MTPENLIEVYQMIKGYYLEGGKTPQQIYKAVMKEVHGLNRFEFLQVLNQILREENKPELEEVEGI